MYRLVGSRVHFSSTSGTPKCPHCLVSPCRCTQPFCSLCGHCSPPLSSFSCWRFLSLVSWACTFSSTFSEEWPHARCRCGACHATITALALVGQSAGACYPGGRQPFQRLGDSAAAVTEERALLCCPQPSPVRARAPVLATTNAAPTTAINSHARGVYAACRGRPAACADRGPRQVCDARMYRTPTARKRTYAVAICGVGQTSSSCFLLLAIARQQQPCGGRGAHDGRCMAWARPLPHCPTCSVMSCR